MPSAVSFAKMCLNTRVSDTPAELRSLFFLCFNFLSDDMMGSKSSLWELIGFIIAMCITISYSR